MEISNKFIDKFFENANPSFIIVYIFLLRLCREGECNISRAADKLNVMESDIRRALKYWEKADALKAEENEDGALKIDFFLENEEKSGKESEKRLSLPAIAATRPVYTSSEIDYYLESSVSLRKLFKCCEAHMGKLLSYNDMCVLFSLHDWLRMPFELIELLVEYCCSNGHRSIRYIESVAVTWADAGIDTAEKAKARIKLYNNDFRRIMCALGKRDREPVKSEADFMVKWLKTLKMPLEIVVAACERTVLQTNRPTFQYADRIIENWHADNVLTPEDIERHNEQYKDAVVKTEKERTRKPKTRKTGFSNFKERENVDFSEIQRLEAERIDKELGLSE